MRSKEAVMPNPPSAAQALYPHLPHDDGREVEQRNKPTALKQCTPRSRRRSPESSLTTN
jgi:hypothetical protein